MQRMIGWFGRGGVLRNDNAKGPWGGRGGSEGGGQGDGHGSGAGGPRNPWAFPPEGKRAKPAAPTSLEEFLKRARGGGGGGGSGGGMGGGPTLAGNAGKLWLFGVLALLAVWVVFTSVHLVGPQQRGVVTTFGSYSGTRGPGFQVTLPAPFSTVRTEDVQEVRIENFPAGEQPNLMLTRDQNIVDLAYSVRWNIKSLEDYAFEIANPQATVRAVAESAMRAAIADADFNQAVGAGRVDLENEVQRRMQALLDEYGSGVAITGVSIKQAAAPQEVDDAFKAVTAAQQEAQSNLNNARAYAQQVLARAQGDAAEFDKIYEQYRLAPDVTRRRLYYETMEQVLQQADKTIVEGGTQTYLPLPEVRRRTPQPDAPAAPVVQPEAAQ